jgi:hypothetical protein
MQLQCNFTGLNGTSSTCTYNRFSGWKMFGQVIWIKKVFFCVSIEASLDFLLETVGVISSKLYRNDEYQVWLCISFATLPDWSAG